MKLPQVSPLLVFTVVFGCVGFWHETFVWGAFLALGLFGLTEARAQNKLQNDVDHYKNWTERLAQKVAEAQLAITKLESQNAELVKELKSQQNKLNQMLAR